MRINGGKGWVGTTSSTRCSRLFTGLLLVDAAQSGAEGQGPEGGPLAIPRALTLDSSQGATGLILPVGQGPRRGPRVGTDAVPGASSQSTLPQADKARNREAEGLCDKGNSGLCHTR